MYKMKTILNKFSLEYHEPFPNQPCLCGSEEIFKKCCGKLYNSDKKDSAFTKFNEGDYKGALKACRLNITWYLLSHRAHTLPFLESGLEEANNILKIDINALSSLLDLLFACYENTDKHKEFLYALDSLTNAISDERWFDRISYQRAVWILFDSDDEKLAFHELTKIKDINKVTDCDILSLYLDIYPGNLSFSKRIKIIDQILSEESNAEIILQYSVLKGIFYFLIGDIEHGIEIIANAIDHFKKHTKDVTAGFGNYKLAQALEILGEFKNDMDILKESQTCYHKEIISGNYNSLGMSMLYKLMADSLYASENYSESIKYYENSLEEDQNDFTKIFYSRALIQSNNLHKAEQILTEITTNTFSEIEKYDYSISWAFLALNTKDKKHILVAGNLLQSLNPIEPYFIQIRDELRFSLQNINEGNSKGIIDKIKRYAILKPSIFGCGIDLNKILEDITSKIKRKTI